MDFKESDDGYIVDDRHALEVKVSEPRGKYTDPIVMVGVQDNGPIVIKTTLTEENWNHLSGKNEFGVRTCAHITTLIEEAAEEIGVEIPNHT
jgi:hypothetical protein